jgi:hypothetical protein
MPFVETRFISPTTLTTSASSALYTVPTGYSAIIKQLVVTNITGTAATFTFYIGSASAGNALFSGTSVAANDTVIINLSQVLTTGEILRALASTGSALNLTVSGVINDGPLASTATYIADNAITSAKIADGAIVNGDINASAAIDQSKIASLTSDLALKANLASPTFTGTPSLPTGTIATTQTAGNSTTAVATTAFATTADNLKANIASPTFTGTPAAPTPSAGTNTTQLATMASRPWNVAWGVMAYNSSTSSDATVSSEEVQITGSSFTAVTGRLYKITYFEPDVFPTNASAYIAARIRLTNISGTLLNECFEQLDVSGVTNRFINLIWLGTITAGTQNVVATLQATGANGYASRGSSTKAFLFVEDIGVA